MSAPPRPAVTPGAAPPAAAVTVRSVRSRRVWLSLLLIGAVLVTAVGFAAVIGVHQRDRLALARGDRDSAKLALDTALARALTDGISAGQLRPVSAGEAALVREPADAGHFRVFDAVAIQQLDSQAAGLRMLIAKVGHVEGLATDVSRLAATPVLNSLDDAIAQERTAGLDAAADSELAASARSSVGHARSPSAVQAVLNGLADRTAAILQRTQAKVAVDAAAAALVSSRSDASAALSRGDRLVLQATPLTNLRFQVDAATLAVQHQAFTAATTIAQYDAVTTAATDAADHIAGLLAARSGAYADMATARSNIQRAITDKVDVGTAAAQLDTVLAQLDQAGTTTVFNGLDAQINQIMAPILDRVGTAELGIGRVIVISLDRQSLTAYQDGVSILSTPITTGRPALPTPPGSYTVLRKNHPWLMTSDWPRTSPYWYPPSEVQYTLWFRNDGYAIHDAPWRGSYGPGTQSNGSHGCVNVPMPTMGSLFSWADVGTRVIVK